MDKAVEDPGMSGIPVTDKLAALPADIAVPQGKLDADNYNAEDLDGVTESLFGSGNLNYLALQARQMDGQAAGGGNDVATGKGEMDLLSGSSAAAASRIFADVRNDAVGLGVISADLGSATAPGTSAPVVGHGTPVAANHDSATGAGAAESFLAGDAIGHDAISFAGSLANNQNFQGGDVHIGGSTTTINNINNPPIDPGTLIENTINNIDNTVNNTVNTVTSTVENIVNNLPDIVENIPTTVTNTVNNLLTTVSNVDLGDTVNQTVSNVTNILNNAPQTVENITHTLTETVTNLPDTVQNVTETVTNVVTNAPDLIETTVNSVTTTVNNLLGGSGGSDIDLSVHNDLGLPQIDANLDPVENIIGDIDISTALTHDALDSVTVDVSALALGSQLVDETVTQDLSSVTVPVDDIVSSIANDTVSIDSLADSAVDLLSQAGDMSTDGLADSLGVSSADTVMSWPETTQVVVDAGDSLTQTTTATIDTLLEPSGTVTGGLSLIPTTDTQTTSGGGLLGGLFGGGGGHGGLF